MPARGTAIRRKRKRKRKSARIRLLVIEEERRARRIADEQHGSGRHQRAAIRLHDQVRVKRAARAARKLLLLSSSNFHKL
jgi:hypothetical protein